jgi:hypothetical protein
MFICRISFGKLRFMSHGGLQGLSCCGKWYGTCDQTNPALSLRRLDRLSYAGVIVFNIVAGAVAVRSTQSFLHRARLPSRSQYWARRLLVYLRFWLPR